MFFILGATVLGVLLFKIIANHGTPAAEPAKNRTSIAPQTTTTKNGTTAQRTTSNDALKDLRAAASADGGVLKSAIVSTSANTYGIVVISEDNNDPTASRGALRIWQLSADQWSAAATVRTAGPVNEISLADANGDNVPDVIADLTAGNQGGSSVLIITGEPPASWKLAPIGDGQAGPQTFYPGPVKAGLGGLVVQYNRCEPDCAAGRNGVQRYEWSGDRFVAVTIDCPAAAAALTDATRRTQRLPIPTSQTFQMAANESGVIVIASPTGGAVDATLTGPNGIAATIDTSLGNLPGYLLGSGGGQVEVELVGSFTASEAGVYTLIATAPAGGGAYLVDLTIANFVNAAACRP